MMAEEEEDFSKLSLDERVQHKNWKARVSAYEELAKIFPKIHDEESGEWVKYGSWVRKLPLDSNAAAQEKGLEVTLLFLEHAGQTQAGRFVSEVMSGIVTKCLTAPRAKSKEFAMSISLMCIELEKFEIVQEELLKGVEHKNPKVVAGSVNILTEGLRSFGPKVINLKTILKKLPVLIEDRDKTVRNETKKLIVELYRWLGSTLKPQLSELKPLVVQEVESEVEKFSETPLRPSRLLRSQQAKPQRVVTEGETEQEVPEVADATASPEMDPLDLLHSIDILTKLPKDFYEKCDAKKWQDRKESLEALETLVAHAKLDAGDYSDLVRTLKRIIGKDSNVVVVALAAKCLTGLANGLQKKFSAYAPSCISTILDKLKEKKANVVAAMRDAIDACFAATSLEAIQEDVVQALGSKNPTVKLETNAFLARTFSKMSFAVISDKKVMKPFFSAIIVNLNESDPSVRDAAAEAFGIALKHLGEKALTTFLADLEPIKLQKVKEFAEQAVISGSKEKGLKPVAPVRAPAKAPPPPVKKPVTVPKKVESSKATGSDQENSCNPDQPVRGDEDGTARVDISDEITESLLKELGDKNWKTRGEALDKISAILDKHKDIKGSIGELAQALVPRLQDSNKNLALNTFLLCEKLAVALGPCAKAHTFTLASPMISGLSDSKVTVRSQVLACINAWADNGGLHEFFQGELISDSLKSGNPFLRRELLNWLSARLPTIRAGNVNKEELNSCLPHLYSGVEDRNPEVRKSSQDAIAPFMLHLGFESMTRHASTLKPMSKAAVQGLLDKARVNLSAPCSSNTTGSRKGQGASTIPKNLATQSGGSAPSKNASEVPSTGKILPVNKLKAQRISDEMKLKMFKWNFLTPREEFVNLLKELMNTAGIDKTLVWQMFHPDFKLHFKALDTLQDKLREDYEGTLSNLDLILKWTTLRFFDTNPSVLIRILDYLSQVFRAVGEKGYQMADVEANAFIPYLILKMGDSKDAVRQKVHQVLRLAVKVYPPLRVSSFLLEGLRANKARQRAECLDELSNMIGTSGLGVVPAGGFKEIAKQIGDRDKDVRNSALNALVQAYFIEGEKVYQMIGQLPEKDQSLMDERIKRTPKPRPAQIPVTPRVEPTRPTCDCCTSTSRQLSPVRPEPHPLKGPVSVLQEQTVMSEGRESEVLEEREDVVVNRHPVYHGQPPRFDMLSLNEPWYETALNAVAYTFIVAASLFVGNELASFLERVVLRRRNPQLLNGGIRIVGSRHSLPHRISEDGGMTEADGFIPEDPLL